MTIDYKNYALSKEDKRVTKQALTWLAFTLIAFMAVLVFMPEPEPEAPFINPDTVRRYTTQQLAEATYWINKEMEERAQGVTNGKSSSVQEASEVRK